jgi:type I restriction enzyme S subunit
MEIPVPSIEIQKKIAFLQMSFERKIYCNSEINRNLEEQADAIYRERFVVHPEDDWMEGHLEELITVKYGKDHKKLSGGTIPCYGSGGIMRYVDKALYDNESVLIPRKGSLNNVIYVNQPFWSVDTMFYSIMKRKNTAKFVFHYVKSKDLASMNTGSAVPSMTADVLNAMEVTIPSANALECFEADILPLYKTMKKNSLENEKLAELRDSFLPKLMSGEIDVSKIDI